MAMQNLSDGLPHLTLLGRLLHSLPALCREITHSFGGFLEYILSGLAYPEEDVKSAVVYVFAQLSMKTQQNSLPTRLVQAVCQFISSNLASAKSHNLTLNILGLVKGLLKSSAYAQCLLQTDRHTSEAKGSTLASAFKRVLLSTDETLQLSGVQCVAEVLTHHPRYGQTLLQTDIAEFMFEALNSKREQLMTSIFSCLNSLATLSDFYSKGHVIYGIDQVISGMMAALEMKNHNATQLGFTFLSVVLQRQPATMPLFTATTAGSLHKLLSVVHSSLQKPATLAPINTLSYLLCAGHLPPGFSLSTLLPLLSLLLHLLELHLMPAHTESSRHTPYTNTSPDSPLDPLKLLSSVLTTLENMHKVCLDAKKPEHKERFIISEDVTVFLSISFEENLLPVILLNAEAIDRCEPLSAFFTIARMQLEGLQEPSSTSTLAEKLVNLGFIHFSFDMKSKFFSAPGGLPLCSNINGCLESLCAWLESDDPQRTTFIREILHATLPDINCELEKSLEFLLQRSSHDVVQSSSTLAQLQRAVLALFYITQHKSGSITPADVVLHALGGFLTLNPDVHLMPAPSLAHLTALYAASVVDISKNKPLSESTKEVSQILVRALLRVPNPASIFLATPHLLSWGFAQPSLQDIARSWFWEWLQGKGDGDNMTGKVGGHTHNSWSEVVEFVQTTPNALDILLGSCDGGVSTTTLSLMDQLLSEVQSGQGDNTVGCIDASGSLKMFHYLQRILLAHRIEPLSEGVTASVMRLLAKCVRRSSATPDIKLVYHALNFVTRCHSDTIVTGLHLLCEILCDSKQVNSQVLALLLSNVFFLERLVSLVPSSSLPKDHSVVSAGALQLIATLIHHNHHQTKLQPSSRPSGAVIPTPSALSTLLSHSTSILVSGLYFWRVVLSTGAHTACFTLCDSATEASLDQDMQALKKLLFLVQNCLVKDDQTVREAAALCLTQLFQYLSTASRRHILEAALAWNQVIVNHISTTSVHSHIPSYYLPCLTAIISQTPPAQASQLKAIAQLLYDSSTAEHNSTERSLTTYASCFQEIQKIDRNLLDVNQWKHLNRTLPQTNQ